jgi:hypothetical protein
MNTAYLLLICLSINLALALQLNQQNDNNKNDQYDYDSIPIMFSRDQKSANPLKLFNKCISDHECKTNEYCDHSGINPIGKCTIGKELKTSCMFDRHCQSKHCHLMRCVARKPVKDGPCAPNEHSECIPSQYCSSKQDTHKCRNRKCSGLCTKDAHCVSNKCSFLMCKKPHTVCLSNKGSS